MDTKLGGLSSRRLVFVLLLAALVLLAVGVTFLAMHGAWPHGLLADGGDSLSRHP